MIKQIKEEIDFNKVNELLEIGWVLITTIPSQPKPIYILGLRERVRNQ